MIITGYYHITIMFFAIQLSHYQYYCTSLPPSQEFLIHSLLWSVWLWQQLLIFQYVKIDHPIFTQVFMSLLFLSQFWQKGTSPMINLAANQFSACLTWRHDKRLLLEILKIYSNSAFFILYCYKHWITDTLQYAQIVIRISQEFIKVAQVISISKSDAKKWRKWDRLSKVAAKKWLWW